MHFKKFVMCWECRPSYKVGKRKNAPFKWGWPGYMKIKGNTALERLGSRWGEYEISGWSNDPNPKFKPLKFNGYTPWKKCLEMGKIFGLVPIIKSVCVNGLNWLKVSPHYEKLKKGQ